MPEENNIKPVKKLSECYKNQFAYCEKCEEYFEDDLPNYGSIICPNRCGYCVERGIKSDSIYFKGTLCQMAEKLRELNYD